MVGIVDDRFEYIFDTLCDVTVALDATDRELKTINHVIQDLESGNLDSSKEKRSLEELKRVLIELRTKRDKIRRDYDYFYGLFTTNLANKCDEALRTAAISFGEKEDDIRDEIVKLEKDHSNLEKENHLRELLRARYNYIEAIYSFLDSQNDFKTKYKRPI